MSLLEATERLLTEAEAHLPTFRARGHRKVSGETEGYTLPLEAEVIDPLTMQRLHLTPLPLASFIGALTDARYLFHKLPAHPALLDALGLVGEELGRLGCLTSSPPLYVADRYREKPWTLLGEKERAILGVLVREKYIPREIWTKPLVARELLWLAELLGIVESPTSLVCRWEFRQLLPGLPRLVSVSTVQMEEVTIYELLEVIETTLKNRLFIATYGHPTADEFLTTFHASRLYKLNRERMAMAGFIKEVGS